MKEKGITWLMAFVMGVLVPGLLFAVGEKLLPATQSIQPTESTAPAKHNAENSIMVLLADDRAQQMDLEMYITGVLLGEMPAGFDSEALKAQAVVARTYALRRNSTGKKHTNGAVCTDPACCQSYCTQSEFLKDGGTQADLDKITAAVNDTKGQVLTYEGNLIEATYFSCSGGRTEDALAVWGTDIPYLQAVDSPGEEAATYYTDTVRYTKAEFARRLGMRPEDLMSGWLGAVTYTDGGGVDTIEIAGTTFRGVALRQKLSLRSTAFSITAIGEQIHIVTRGYGHRVGMSQYGAESMAVAGSSYSEILSHYYPGTSLSDYTRN